VELHKRHFGILVGLIALSAGGCAGMWGQQPAASTPPPTFTSPSLPQPAIIASQQTTPGREMPVQGEAPAPAGTPPAAANAQYETTQTPASAEPAETPPPAPKHHHHRRHRKHHRKHHHHKTATPAATPEPTAPESGAPAPAAPEPAAPEPAAPAPVAPAPAPSTVE
jgi:hypothetical protein